MVRNITLILRRSISQIGHFRKQIVESNYLKSVPNEKSVKKSIRVALIGKANAGKSTLINTMMGLHICAASKRPQTTLEYQRVFYVNGETEIVLLDTPGVVSPRTVKKFKLSDSADVFQINELKTANLVGVIVDATCKFSNQYLSREMKLLLTTLPPTTLVVLILNKVDKLKDKVKLLECVNTLYNDPFSNNSSDAPHPNKFSEVFMISALKNDGVQALVEYICSVATEIVSNSASERLSDHPDAKIVEQRVKAALLEHIEFETPYVCSCKMEYMEENKNGRLDIVVLINCPTLRYWKIIFSKTSHTDQMKIECEQDFCKLFKKEVFLKLQPMLSKRQS